MLTLAACSDDTLGTEPLGEDEEIAGDVYLRIQMNLGDGAPAMGRTGVTPSVQETPGTTSENQINSVDILVYDIDDDMLANVIPLDDQQIQLVKAEKEVVVPIFATQGHRVKIYAAVNMTDEMRRQFAFGQPGTDFSISTGENTYQNVINQFVPGSNGKQDKLNSGIPMTGQFKIAANDVVSTSNPANSDVITITRDHIGRDNPLNIVAELRRIVAKVHVVVTMEDPGSATNTYVMSRSAIDPAQQQRYGWVSLEDVHYIPNGINKSTYIFPQYDNNGKPMDRNMGLDHYVTTDWRIDQQLWEPDYMFTLNGTLYHNLEDKTATEKIAAQVEKYDKTRLDNTLSGNGYPLSGDDSDYSERYVKGMYCTENYFDTPVNHTFFSQYSYAIPMITHVTVAAKMTPCTILVENDFAEKMDDEQINVAQGDGKTTSSGRLTPDEIDTWQKTIRDKYFTTPDKTTVPGFIKITADSKEDIIYILTCSLKLHDKWSGTPDYNNNKFPSGTFYVFDQSYEGEYTGERFLCLTAGAVLTASGDNAHIKSRSVPHVGGWGYYYTYIDNDGSTVNKKTPYTASQVTRNTYYIITVGNFGFPGGTITSPMTIKANTIPVGWDYVGRGETNLH